MDRTSAAEKYKTEYQKILTVMNPKEIGEELSYLLAIKDAVSDRYDDYQSVISYMVDTMFESCHDEVLSRAIGGTLEPIPENLV